MIRKQAEAVVATIRKAESGLATKSDIAGLRTDMEAGFEKQSAETAGLRTDTAAGFERQEALMKAGFERQEAVSDGLRTAMEAGFERQEALMKAGLEKQEAFTKSVRDAMTAEVAGLHTRVERNFARSLLAMVGLAGALFAALKLSG